MALTRIARPIIGSYKTHDGDTDRRKFKSRSSASASTTSQSTSSPRKGSSFPAGPVEAGRPAPTLLDYLKSKDSDRTPS